MTRKIFDNRQAQDVDRRRLLLLGDDGRMERMLRRRFRQLHLTCEDNVLDGIVRLDEMRFATVLLNAGRLEQQTAEAVKALRRIGPASKILVYGEPFTEVYSRQALRAGADDYIIWPIPFAELRDYLIPTPPQPTASIRGTALPSAQIGAMPDALGVNDDLAAQLLTQYQELAKLIPKGKEVLLERAQKKLAQMLHVEWIDIHLAVTDGSKVEPWEDAARKGATSVITMNGPLGSIGRLVLGPALSPVQNHRALAQPIGDLLATLLHLAERDESLKHLATVDELTQAYNRRYMEYFLRQVIEQSEDRDTEVTMLLFDIDEFKYYNDTYGHLAGDEILREATRLIRRCCRAHDIVARIGGDEFAVLFWDTGEPREPYDRDEPEITTDLMDNAEPQQSYKHHPQVAMFLSNRFRRALKTNEFPSLGPDARGKLTISGGLACYPYDGNTLEELLAKADEALLSAKRFGKNRIYLVGQPDGEE
jgi:GGDEF domain-containing protein/DNA-binding NarL/FixJ family response regulator